MSQYHGNLDLISTKEYAELNNRNERTVRRLAQEGRLSSAIKKGSKWLIDKNEEYPESFIKPRKDLKGKRFGRLLVISEIGYKAGLNNCFWLCECDCGNEKEISSNNLLNGNTSSCGCLHLESAKNQHRKMMNAESESNYKEGTSLKNIDVSNPRNDNTSGVTGVSWNKSRQKWECYLNLKGNRIRLGMFSNKEDAIRARKEAEEKYYRPIIEKYSKGSEI